MFVSTNRTNVLNLKYSSDKLVIVSNGFLKLPQLHMPLKQESLSLPQKLGSQNFWRIVKSVLNKDKSAIPPLLNGQELLPSAYHKEKLFTKNFSKNSNLDNSGISFL